MRVLNSKSFGGRPVTAGVLGLSHGETYSRIRHRGTVYLQLFAKRGR